MNSAAQGRIIAVVVVSVIIIITKCSLLRAGNPVLFK